MQSLKSGFDFDGDGYSDILWEGLGPQPGPLLYAIWYQGQYANSKISGTASPLAGVSGGDFNGDGKSDLLTIANPDSSNQPGAQIEGVIWLGGDQGRSIDIGVLPKSTQTMVGDFDGDGKSDILFWNTSTGGALVVWDHADSTTAHTLGFVGFDGQRWRIYSGDFDGDGKSDLLFEKYQTVGSRTATVQQNYNLVFWSAGDFHKAVDLGSMAGQVGDLVIGDFDGDGRSEILVYSAGKIYHWNGDSPNAETFIGDAPGRPQNVGDLNGDGKDDLAFLVPSQVTSVVDGALWTYDNIVVWNSANPASAHALPSLLHDVWYFAI